MTDKQLGTAGKLRMMTFNILVHDHSWKARCGLLARILRDSSPTICGLQEATRIQLVYIKTQLPPWYQISGENYLGNEWYDFSKMDWTGEDGQAWFNAVIYDTRKVSLFRKENIYFKIDTKTPWKPLGTRNNLSLFSVLSVCFSLPLLFEISYYRYQN